MTRQSCVEIGKWRVQLFLAGPKNPMLVLSARLAIRHRKAKVRSAAIKQNSWLKGRQPLNPDSPADAANVERALHSQQCSTSRPADRKRTSSHWDVLALSCLNPSVAFTGISGRGRGGIKKIKGNTGSWCCGRGTAALRAVLRASCRSWPAAEPHTNLQVAAAGLSARRGCDCSIAWHTFRSPTPSWQVLAEPPAPFKAMSSCCQSITLPPKYTHTVPVREYEAAVLCPAYSIFLKLSLTLS